jgi:hypothetical protein
MFVDCDACVVRGTACAGCVISVVLGAPPAGVELEPEERRALRVLAAAGMVPELRLVIGRPGEPPGGGAGRPVRAARRRRPAA